MELDDITPLILTYNESANIRETLTRLDWAKRVVIVDSFSTDETLAIVSGFPRVQIFQRQFDHFADQCNFGLTKITTQWTLSLDADYKCPRELARELVSLGGSAVGYQAAFRYCVYGKPLRTSLYPPRTVLYQTRAAKYERDGHAHRVKIDGSIGRLRATILHDDWKSLSTWLTSQTKYAIAEAAKLEATSSENLNWKDRLRKQILLAPLLTAVYCLFVKRLILSGRAGLFYSMQRTYAELLLSLVLIDRRMRK